MNFFSSFIILFFFEFTVTFRHKIIFPNFYFMSKTEELYGSPNFYTKTAQKHNESPNMGKTRKLTKEEQENMVDRMVFKDKPVNATKDYIDIIAKSPSPFANKKRTPFEEKYYKNKK